MKSVVALVLLLSVCYTWQSPVAKQDGDSDNGRSGRTFDIQSLMKTKKKCDPICNGMLTSGSCTFLGPVSSYINLFWCCPLYDVCCDKGGDKGDGNEGNGSGGQPNGGQNGNDGNQPGGGGQPEESQPEPAEQPASEAPAAEESTTAK